jgi:flagellar protein FliO/FliZ
LSFNNKNQFVLGRGKLKKNVFAFQWKAALLVLSAVFLIQNQTISAQEEVPSEQLSVVDPLRAAELSFTFEDNEAVTALAAGTSTWAIVRMILILALVAAAIYGIVFLFKRVSKQAPASDPFLKVLASTHLGGSRYAHIVSVGSKAWLLGAGESGVSLISEIEDKEIVDAMIQEDSRKSASAATGRFPDFPSLLRQFGLRIPAQTNIPSADDIRKRRERLKGL